MGLFHLDVSILGANSSVKAINRMNEAMKSNFLSENNSTGKREIVYKNGCQCLMGSGFAGCSIIRTKIFYFTCISSGLGDSNTQ
jgi:hypothetical protein